MSVASTIVLLLFVASLLFFPSVSVLRLDPPHKRSALTDAKDIARVVSCSRWHGVLATPPVKIDASEMGS